MDYRETYTNLMNKIDNINPANITENTVETETSTTVYEDFRLTVSNDMLSNAGLSNIQRIFVYVSNNQNVIYLTNKNSIGEEFGISKIIKHTPNKGIRLNIGKVLNIGEVPCEVKVQVQNDMIKIYPKDGIEKLPATKAFEAVSDTVQKVYGFSIHQFLNRIEKGVL